MAGHECAVAVREVQRSLPITAQKPRSEECGGAGITGADAVGVFGEREAGGLALQPTISCTSGGAAFATGENDRGQIVFVTHCFSADTRIAFMQIEQSRNPADFVVIEFYQISHLATFIENLSGKEIHAQIHVKNLQRIIRFGQK